jgi:hypothetical protein
VLLSVVLLGSASSSIARADAPDRTQGASPAGVLPQVELALVGDVGAAAGLADRIESWFRGQTTIVRRTTMASLQASLVFSAAKDPGVRVWILFSSPTDVHLVFAVQQGAGTPPRYLVKEVPLDSGLDELQSEQIAQVVYLSAQGLWAGNVESTRHDVEQSLGVAAPAPAPPRDPPALPAPAVPDATPRPIPVRAVASAGVDYAVKLAGDEGLAQAPGAAVALSWRIGPTEIGGRLRAAVLLPHTAVRSGVHLDLKGLAFAVAGTVAGRVARSTWVVGEAGPGLEITSYRVASVDDPSLRPGGGGTDPRPTLHVRAGVRADLGVFRLECDALVVVQLLRAHYDVSIDGSRSEALVASIVQPGLAAGVSW